MDEKRQQSISDLTYKCDLAQEYAARKKSCYEKCLLLRDDSNQPNRGYPHPGSHQAREKVRGFALDLKNRLSNTEDSVLDKKLGHILKQVEADADQMQIAEVRRGRLGEIAREKKHDLTRIRRSIDSYLSQVLRECATGDVNREPCLNHAEGLKMTESLVTISNNQNLTWDAFYPWWGSKPATNFNFPCEKMEWIEYQRVTTNMRLDRACFDRFEKEAPADEWENLTRLWQLARRPVDGRAEAEEERGRTAK